MIYAFTSYGNDSIALIQWLNEHRGRADNVVTVYSDTGWADPSWPARVERAEAWVRTLGWTPVRIASEGFVALARRKKGFPRNGMQFCTQELKIVPALAFLEREDPDGEATCCVGVRREESVSRRIWPEWVDESEKHGGRLLWSPLVRVLEPERNELVARAGFEVLPHRSRECYPCVNSSRADLRGMDEERIAYIESIEAEIERTLFRAGKFMGASGIREIIRWANSPRGGYEPPSTAGCDSGFCGS